MRARSGLARNLRDLDAVLITPGTEAQQLTFFRVAAGELRGPATLTLDENVSEPVSLDDQIRALLEPLGSTAGQARDSRASSGHRPLQPRVPPWEHLSLLARWYYSSFRTGEIVMLEPARPGAQSRGLPTRALIRACRKVLAPNNSPSAAP
jgi:hypothetical protein